MVDFLRSVAKPCHMGRFPERFGDHSVALEITKISTGKNGTCDGKFDYGNELYLMEYLME